MKKFVPFLFILPFMINFTSNQTLFEACLKMVKEDDTLQLKTQLASFYTAYLRENTSYHDAVKALRAKDEKSTFIYLDSLIKDDLFLDELPKDTQFLTLHDHRTWKKLIDTINYLKAHYNESLRQQLKSIQGTDQGIRLFYLASLEYYQKNDPIPLKIHQVMKQIDEENGQKIQAFLSKNGWIGQRVVGKEGNETLFLGIQHIDDLLVQEKYLLMLQKAVKAGNAEPWHLAFLTDRIAMNHGKKQTYGTQVILSDNPSESYVVPLQDPEKVDQWRKEIGLPPLREYLKEDGIIWDLKTYKNDLPRIESLYRQRKNKKQMD